MSTPKQKFTISNENGQEAAVYAPHHHQHIWNRTTLPVSPKVADRVRAELGEGPLHTTIEGRPVAVEFGRCSQCGA